LLGDIIYTSNFLIMDYVSCISEERDIKIKGVKQGKGKSRDMKKCVPCVVRIHEGKCEEGSEVKNGRKRRRFKKLGGEKGEK